MTASTAPGPAAGPARRAALLLLALVPLALVAVLAADVAGAGALVLQDAGALARRGAPVTAMLADLAGAVVLGGAVLAGWLLDDESDRARALLAVAVAGAVTTLARGASLLLSYAIATGQGVGTERFGSDLGVFVRTDLGVWLLAGVLAAAVTTTVAVSGTGRGIARLLAVLAGVLAFCAAMTGHAAGDASHEVATSTMLVHLLAVGIWGGGLLVLQLLPERSRDDARVLRGYSHLALIAWSALAISGVWALAVRMTAPSEILTSAYVQLGVAKAALLVALGALGVLQRRALASRADRAARGHPARAAYRHLALLELALMGLAVALAAAMSSSPPPADDAAPASGAVGILTGYPMPPDPVPLAVLTAWRPAPFALALVCALLLVWWRPGGPDRPRAATARLLAGSALLVLATNGPTAVYSKVLVSAHLGEHLLLIGAGVLLGSALARPTVLTRRLGRSAALGPLLAALPAAVLVLVYGTGLLRLALDSHAAHLALQMAALAAGAGTTLLVRCAPRPRITALAPALVLLGAGAGLLLGDVLLAASWFGASGRAWGPDALTDQRRGGLLVLAGAVLVALGIGGSALRGGRRD